MQELITVGVEKCAFMELVSGVLRVVDLFNVVLQFLKTLGFWKTLTV